MKTLLIINGPNLDKLGQREENYYGNITLKKININIKKLNNKYFKIKFFQSNHEGKIIDFITKNIKKDYIIINPGALTHTSIALRDCLSVFKGKIIEVHLSDIYKREDFRKTNYIKDLCVNSFVGLKDESYYEALKYLLKNNSMLK